MRVATAEILRSRHCDFVQSAAFLAYRAEHNTETYVIVLGTSAIALTYNIVHSVMIQQTSAVTTTVIGQAKIIGLLILSALLLGGSSTCHCYLGIS